MVIRSLYVHIVKTPWGAVPIAASGDGVAAVGLPGVSAKSFFARLKRKYPDFLFVEKESPDAVQGGREISEYLEGGRREFSVPFHIRVSPFQFNVLEAISAIPYGETATYGEVAACLGKPKAARAVGAACGANPVPLIVPCHRVVAANGLGGFAGGLGLKKKLLAHERYHAGK